MPAVANSLKLPDSGRTQQLHVVAGAYSVQGTRREQNEDRQYVSPDKNVFIVADGMGGHDSGEVASKFAVDVLSHELAKIAVDSSQQEIEQRVRAALNRAHCLIVDTASKASSFKTPGTTVVFGLLQNHRLYITGVGDSRAYLVRGGTIERLTIDDTWPDALFHLGQISSDEAKRHHLRNLLVTALGMKDFDSDQEEIRAVDVFDGDRFLLASDGLTDVVEDNRMLEIISENHNPQAATELLAQEAIAGNSGDDITSLLFYIQSEHGPTTSAASNTFWQRLAAVFKNS